MDIIRTGLFPPRGPKEFGKGWLKVNIIEGNLGGGKKGGNDGKGHQERRLPDWGKDEKC